MSSEHQAVPTGSTAETHKHHHVLLDSGEGRHMASGKLVEKSGIFSKISKAVSGFGGADEEEAPVKVQRVEDNGTASDPTVPIAKGSAK